MANDFHAALVPVCLQVRVVPVAVSCLAGTGKFRHAAASASRCHACCAAAPPTGALLWPQPEALQLPRPELLSPLVTFCCVARAPFQAHYRDHGQMLYARSLLVVHNLAHQGGCCLLPRPILHSPLALRLKLHWMGSVGSCTNPGAPGRMLGGQQIAFYQMAPATGCKGLHWLPQASAPRPSPTTHTYFIHQHRPGPTRGAGHARPA